MPIFIYGLKCPLAGVVRYIGKSIDPQKRFSAHVSSAICGFNNHHTARWIRKLNVLGLAPELVILHSVGDSENWRDVERSFIASAKDRGWKLTNTTAGGEGLDYLDPADDARYRANLSAAMTELWNRPERKEEARQRSLKAWADPRISKNRVMAVRAAHTDPVLKERMREVGREIGARPEVSAAKSASMKATFSDPARKAIHDAALSTDEVRAKMSTSAKTRFKRPGAKAYLSTPERRQQASESAKRRATPEYRAMMSEKTRQSWEKRKRT